MLDTAIDKLFGAFPCNIIVRKHLKYVFQVVNWKIDDFEIVRIPLNWRYKLQINPQRFKAVFRRFNLNHQILQAFLDKFIIYDFSK